MPLDIANFDGVEKEDEGKAAIEDVDDEIVGKQVGNLPPLSLEHIDYDDDGNS